VILVGLAERDVILQSFTKDCSLLPRPDTVRTLVLRQEEALQTPAVEMVLEVYPYLEDLIRLLSMLAMRLCGSIGVQAVWTTNGWQV
jgi:hypothetical protein